MNLPQANLYAEVREELSPNLPSEGSLKSLWERPVFEPPPWPVHRPQADEHKQIASRGQPC